jgi:hypothetical protein
VITPAVANQHDEDTLFAYVIRQAIRLAQQLAYRTPAEGMQFIHDRAAKRVCFEGRDGIQQLLDQLSRDPRRCVVEQVSMAWRRCRVWPSAIALRGMASFLQGAVAKPFEEFAGIHAMALFLFPQSERRVRQQGRHRKRRVAPSGALAAAGRSRVRSRAAS